MKRVVALACVFAAVTASAVADAGGASFPGSSAIWTGTSLRLAVACAAGGSTCRGVVSVYDPADTQRANRLADGDYGIAAGTTATIAVGPSSSAAARRIASLSSIVARAHAEAAPPPEIAEATLTLVHRTPTAPKPKRLGPPTTRQIVGDKRGDSHGCFGLDIVKATATRKGRTVVFKVFNAGPMTQHDGFGNRITPGLEYVNPRGGHTVQAGADGHLRGWTMRVWPKVPTVVTSKTVTWKVPFKYLAKPKIKWRMECLEGYNVRDAAPNKGYTVFIR